ncbi:MAG: PAS domain-containing sensor histidine kinase [Armatimonadota bacterium]|nr:PAS domain-containing sensor histidine kinase [Armatimonadota bacterium]
MNLRNPEESKSPTHSPRTSPVAQRSYDIPFTPPPERVLDHLSLAVVVMDLLGRVAYLNRKACNLLGYTAEEACGRPFDEVAHLSRPSTNLPVDSFQGLDTNGKRNGELAVVRTRDGREIRVLLDVRLLEQEAGNVEGCVITLRELSSEPPADGWVYLGVASHELRTPLTALRWGLELLLEETHGPLSPEQRELIGLAYEGTLSMVGLVEDVLDASRIEEGRLELLFQEVSLPELLEDLKREFRILGERRGLKLEWEIPREPCPKVWADPERLRQVVRNLLSNAIKYTPRGGTVTVSLRREDKELVLTVVDEGIGIPREEQDRIFTKFFRATNAVRWGAEGTGFGLYIAKAIVEAFGGSIGFHSEEGVGTTFWVRLPLKREGG